MLGVGTEWREADSPRNQAILPDGEVASIVSDNGDTLLKVYRDLPDDEARERYVAALLSRLSRESEYAPVAYLILLTLFRVRRLPDALITAKRELMNDRAYGFSDFVRLLDGLLRTDHKSFEPKWLDEIERFLEGIDEHTFHIGERVAAIRAYRLAKGTQR
jgi:hypothetical protein